MISCTTAITTPLRVLSVLNLHSLCDGPPAGLPIACIITCSACLPDRLVDFLCSSMVHYYTHILKSTYIPVTFFFVCFGLASWAACSLACLLRARLLACSLACCVHVHEHTDPAAQPCRHRPPVATPPPPPLPERARARLTHYRTTSPPAGTRSAISPSSEATFVGCPSARPRGTCPSCFWEWASWRQNCCRCDSTPQQVYMIRL